MDLPNADESRPFSHPKPMIDQDDTERVLRILTVGDGDFSGSRAILRAYSNRIETLVATTLLASKDELIRTYPHSEEILAEMESFSCAYPKAQVFYGIDGTQLHNYKELADIGPFDFILFQHPHLGYGSSSKTDKQSHDLAQRHSSLVSHYLYSASHLLVQTPEACQLQYPPCIHLCLSAGQSKNWRLKGVLRRLGFGYACEPRFVAQPLFGSWVEPMPFAPERKARTTKGNTQASDQSSPVISAQEKHYPLQWLSRYGYTHQATHPQATIMNSAVNSHHHFFSRTMSPQTQISPPSFAQHSSTASPNSYVCPVCLESCVSETHLKDHWNAPAVPVDAGQAIVVDLDKKGRLGASSSVNI